MNTDALSLGGEWRPLLLIAATGTAAALLTMLVATLTGAMFVLWFKDASGILLVELIYLLALALVWDAALISASAARRLLPAAKPPASGRLASWKRLGFFSLGPAPLALIFLTSAFVIGTSNITLINLEFLQGKPAWRDPFLWSIESPLFERLSSADLDMGLWDRIYNGAWPLEVFAVFAMTLLMRNTRVFMAFCFSFILLFYLGRFLGVVNPVLGPAFFHPEFFTKVAGSISGSAMHLVARVISDPAIAEQSAVLLGGVSAMPSLHVGMVALTAYWLWKAGRWTAFITIPWVVLVWIATVVLGWHYILDGMGGFALAWFCVSSTTRLLQGKVGLRTSGSPTNHP